MNEGKAGKESNYSASNIQVLEGLDTTKLIKAGLKEDEPKMPDKK